MENIINSLKYGILLEFPLDLFTTSNLLVDNVTPPGNPQAVKYKVSKRL